MIKKRTIFAVSALVLAVASANAQTVAKPYSVALGYNYLSTKDARDATKANGYNVALGYHLQSVELGKLNVAPSVELGFARNGSGDERADVFSLQLVGRVKLVNNLYCGLGLGVSKSDLRRSETGASSGSSGGTITTKYSDNKTSFSGKLLVGTSLGQDIFGEVAYLFNGSVTGVKTDAVSVSVGIRF